MIHKIYRNGRLYDSLDHNDYAVVQIVRGWGRDHPDDEWEIKDSEGEVYFATGPFSRLGRVGEGYGG